VGGLGDAGVGLLGPGERLAAVVPGVDEALADGDEGGDGGKLPRRSAWRVTIEMNASTKFSQEPEVGVKCRCTRGWRVSQARTPGCLWVA